MSEFNQGLVIGTFLWGPTLTVLIVAVWAAFFGHETRLRRRHNREVLKRADRFVSIGYDVYDAKRFAEREMQLEAERVEQLLA